MENYIVYISGGTMRGVFGAGVATYLQETGLHRSIRAMYGSSAGALTAAYLLAEQTRLGSSIFYEDLVRGFISTKNFWAGMADRLANRCLPRTAPRPVRDAFDLDYLFRAVTTHKRLAVEKLRNHPIELWVKVLGLNSGVPRYLHIGEHDPLTLLRASVSAMPYVSSAVTIGNEAYVDAAVVDPIGFAELRRRHPTEKIVVVFNGDERRALKKQLKCRIEGAFAQLMFGRFYDHFARAEARLQKDLLLIKEDPRALLITYPPGASIATRTRDPERLRSAYRCGIIAGTRLESFVRN